MLFNFETNHQFVKKDAPLAGYYFFGGLGCGYSRIAIKHLDRYFTDTSQTIHLVFIEDREKVLRSKMLDEVKYDKLLEYNKQEYKPFKTKQIVPKLYLVHQNGKIERINIDDLWLELKL